jgi:lipopolysaccharide export system protein LptC
MNLDKLPAESPPEASAAPAPDPAPAHAGKTRSASGKSGNPK